MKNYLKALTQSKFVRNVAIVATGTAGAQAITMAFAPLVTRLYGPEAFGLLGTFMAVLAILTPIAALTYPIAIVLPKSDTDAKKLAQLSAILAFIVSIMTTIVLLIGGEWIAQALNLEAIAGFLILIPVAMLLAAFQQILNQWLIRKQQFKITARAAVIQALTMNSAKVGVGWFHPVGITLIIIATIGHGFHAALLWSGIRSREAANSNQDKSTATVTGLASRHRDFPFYRAPQVALNAISQSLPILVLASTFGASAAGFFALTKSVLAAPAGLIGVSVGNVFYPKAAELQDDPANLHKFMRQTSLSLLTLGALVFFPVLLGGPWLFILIFGPDWETAGEFARWVALWLVLSLAARPVISAIPVVGMQGVFLLFETIFLPLKVVSLGLGVYFSSAVYSVALYSLVSSVFYVALYILIARRMISLGSV